MKKLISLFVIFLIFTFLNAEGLNQSGNYIKNNYPEEYEKTIKKQALIEWGNDFRMVVYEINKQSEALIDIVTEFESDNTNILFRAIQEWSTDGYENKNIVLFKKLSALSVKNLLQLNCDWRMVKYEYDKQVKAKNSF